MVGQTEFNTPIFMTFSVMAFLFSFILVSIQYKDVKTERSLRTPLFFIKFCLACYLIACYLIAIGLFNVAGVIISISLPMTILSIQEISAFNTSKKLYIKLVDLLKGNSESKVHEDINQINDLINQVEERVPGYKSKELMDARILLEKLSINK